MGAYHSNNLVRQFASSGAETRFKLSTIMDRILLTYEYYNDTRPNNNRTVNKDTKGMKTSQDRWSWVRSARQPESCNHTGHVGFLPFGLVRSKLLVFGVDRRLSNLKRSTGGCPQALRNHTEAARADKRPSRLALGVTAPIWPHRSFLYHHGSTRRH